MTAVERRRRRSHLFWDADNARRFAARQYAAAVLVPTITTGSLRGWGARRREGSPFALRLEDAEELREAICDDPADPRRAILSATGRP